MGKLKDYFPDCDENPEPTLTPEEEDAMMESLLDFESLCDNPSATTEESEEMWNWWAECGVRVLEFIRTRGAWAKSWNIYEEYRTWGACQKAADMLTR